MNIGKRIHKTKNEHEAHNAKIKPQNEHKTNIKRHNTKLVRKQ